MKKRLCGFTLIEVMVVVAIIAILAMIAAPNMRDRIVREQIVEAMKLADIAKAPVGASWTLTKTFPADNVIAGLPEPDKIVSNFVRSIAIENGAIHVTFGNKVNGAISGKTLTLRPAVVPDAQVVPVTWVCANAAPPDKMTVNGTNRSTIEANLLPLNCRG